MQTIEHAIDTLGEEFAFFHRVLQPLIDELSLPKDARILDVGTGKGRVALTLVLNGYRVITGEPVDDHSEYAKQNWREEAEKVGATPAIGYRDLDAQQMTFEDGSFDAVFAMGAIHHMSEPARAIAEIIRVLAPGGVAAMAGIGVPDG